MEDSNIALRICLYILGAQRFFFFLSFFKELNKTAFISVIIKYLKIFLAGPKAKTENDCYLWSTSFSFFLILLSF